MNGRKESGRWGGGKGRNRRGYLDPEAIWLSCSVRLLPWTPPDPLSLSLPFFLPPSLPLFYCPKATTCKYTPAFCISGSTGADSYLCVRTPSWRLSWSCSAPGRPLAKAGQGESQGQSGTHGPSLSHPKPWPLSLLPPLLHQQIREVRSGGWVDAWLSPASLGALSVTPHGGKQDHFWLRLLSLWPFFHFV